MSTLKEIAQQIKDLPEKIVLIYAFNSSGKTQLSVEYKNITKHDDGSHAGVYYNAFSEDLFTWDNDEENDNVDIKLNIKQSSLNQFHSFLIENSDSINEKLAQYLPKYKFRLNPFQDSEQGIESVSFFIDEDSEHIKISRGEERIFIWCFFLALFEVDAWAGKQNAHFFIDDPVSSLDDNNIFTTAQTILDIIEKYFEKRKIIITTHHIGLYSILFDRLCKGEKSGKFKSETKPFILVRNDNGFELKNHDKDVFLFHLHLMQKLDEAIKNKLYLYHFVLLRQLLENISSFLGSGKLGYVLSQIGIEKSDEVASMINSLSHQNTYRHQFNEMSLEQENTFKDIFNKIQDKYNFRF
ncbi:AAA family ATPase [Ignavibacterium album]|uniref:AAA family ATPase n=1 Tax=Ignavibacterium album TaxID=591197 RepID=UPI0026F1B3F4|nr:AAA family ATPase [Ignavibacterium album]